MRFTKNVLIRNEAPNIQKFPLTMLNTNYLIVRDKIIYYSSKIIKLLRPKNRSPYEFAREWKIKVIRQCCGDYSSSFKFNFMSRSMPGIDESGIPSKFRISRSILVSGISDNYSEIGTHLLSSSLFDSSYTFSTIFGDLFHSSGSSRGFGDGVLHFISLPFTGFAGLNPQFESVYRQNYSTTEQEKSENGQRYCGVSEPPIKWRFFFFLICTITCFVWCGISGNYFYEGRMLLGFSSFNIGIVIGLFGFILFLLTANPDTWCWYI